MRWTDDPERDADRYESDQHDRLIRRPQCFFCGENIQDEKAVKFPKTNLWMCFGCIKDYTQFLED